jgi:beta-glucanase (GH16 family)
MCLGMIGAENWPPEIDFYEDFTNASNTTRNSMAATDHWGAGNNQQTLIESGVDATQWHTWEVIWNANSITYLVDGAAWNMISNPDNNTVDPNSLVQPQMLFMQIENGDGTSTNSATPSVVTMQIDWIAVFVPN